MTEIQDGVGFRPKKDSRRRVIKNGQEFRNEKNTEWKRNQKGEQDAILRRIQDGHGLKTERDLGH